LIDNEARAFAERRQVGPSDWLGGWPQLQNEAKYAERPGASWISRTKASGRSKRLARRMAAITKRSQIFGARRA